MCFRANECVSPEVKAQISRKVPGEVVDAVVVSAGQSAGVIGPIEAKIFAADSRHHVRADFLADHRPVHGVEVVENRAIRLRNQAEPRLHPAINFLPGAPGDLTSETDVALKEKNSAEARVEPSTQRGKRISLAVSGGAWRCDRAEPERPMKLLRLGGATQGKGDEE